MDGNGAYRSGAMGSGIRPDTIIFAKNVHTNDPTRPVAEAIAIIGQTIVAVGSRREAAEWDHQEARIFDIPDATVTPGFVDAHIHPISGAERRFRAVDLAGLDTIEALRAAVAAHAATLPPGEWLIGNGMPFHAFIGEKIGHSHFADIFADRPAVLNFFDGHSNIVSAEGLRRAGITGAVDFGNNAEIVVDESGEPTGYLIETDAQEMVARVVPPLTREARKEAVYAQLCAFAATGLTSLHALNFSKTDIQVLEDIEAEGELPVRVRISPMWNSMDDWDATFRSCVDLQGVGGRRWGIEGVKFQLDGTIENGSAWLAEPDVDGGGTTPYWVPNERIERAIHSLAINGIPVAVHAIGDRGVEFILDTIASIPDLGQGLVHRVEHIETIPDATVPRFAELGVAASMQPMHVLSTNADETDLWSLKLGAGSARTRAKWRIKDIEQTGAIVTLGSDWPVEEFDARQVFATNILRRRPFTTQAPIRHDQGLDATTTLKQITQQAWASIGRPRDGILAPGSLADLSVFQGDPLTLAPEEFARTPVLLTFVGGTISHNNLPSTQK